MCRLRNNLYNDFEVASSTSTALPDNEMHDHSFVCEHANDLLQQTYEGSSNDSTENAGYIDLGDASETYAYCQVAMRYQERTRKNRNQANAKYTWEGYNFLFSRILQCFCNNYYVIKNHTKSQDRYKCAQRKGPVIYKIHGQACHLIGSLLPMPQKPPKFAQLYIYDTKNEIQNKIGAVVAVIVGDASQPINQDIILEKQSGHLQRINELHLSYLGLQYPPLFPYGEDGYHSDIKHGDMDDSHQRNRYILTIREFLCFRLQSKKDKAQTLLRSKRLFQRFIVKAYHWGSGQFLRRLFVTMLISNSIERPYHVLAKTWKCLIDDILHQQRRIRNIQAGGMFFMYGYGGTGKTFMWKTLTSALRSKGDIILTVASSGIASLLLPNDKIAHLKFAIPVPALDNSTCNIDQGTEQAKLLKATKLIIWDEAPMAHKYCFEALDKTLNDIIVQSKSGLKILIHDKGGKPLNITTDVVFNEVLQNL
ncbi:ATP-dependent DNA helicase PIF4 [Glycine max]|nr:ATP-dependent DNA helicase PIF4 [Glycine max]